MQNFGAQPPLCLSLQTGIVLYHYLNTAWSRSRMDTTNASGALDTGSIPVGTTYIYI